VFAVSQPGTPGPGAALRGGSPLTAPLSVSLSLSPLQSAQRLEEAPEETASEWLPSRWFLSKPLFQPAPGFVHTRSGCSRRGMELGTPGIQQEDHGDPIRCLEMCRLAAWGVWQDMGRFRKPLGPQTLCPTSGDRVSLGHSQLCSSETSAEGQQLLSPYPDLDHRAASSLLPVPRILAIRPHPPHPLGHLEPLPELSFRLILERGKASGPWWLFWPCLHGARERQAAGQGWSWALATPPHGFSAFSVARSSG